MLVLVSLCAFLFSLSIHATVQSDPGNHLEDPNVELIGRWIWDDGRKVYRNRWAGTRVMVQFQNTSQVFLETTDMMACRQYHVLIDDMPFKHTGSENIFYDYPINNTLLLARGLDRKRIYTLTLFCEYNSHFFFKNFAFDKGARTIPMQLPKYSIEWIGDSITRGQGVTNTIAGTYGWLTSQALGVLPYYAAQAGIALVDGASFAKMTGMYSKYYQNGWSKGLFNLSIYDPDIIVVNLGTNDKLSGRGRNFTQRYVEFIHNLRAAHPPAEIICLRTFGDYMLNETLDAIQILKAEDFPRLTYVDTNGWIPREPQYYVEAERKLHPSDAGHRAAAKHMTEILRPFVSKLKGESAPQRIISQMATHATPSKAAFGGLVLNDKRHLYAGQKADGLFESEFQNSLNKVLVPFSSFVVMAYPDTFKGYLCDSKASWNKFRLGEFTPKRFEEYDIDIKINYCGVCGSDIHSLREGWGPSIYPLVVGHEIVGKVVRVGEKVKSIKVGGIVGVGAQAWACGDCADCKNDSENYCLRVVETYNWKYESGDLAYGGYANYVRVHEQFVYPVPEGLDEATIAPFFCAGLTVFSPLKRNGPVKGKNVGVIGIGGLGHFGLMLAAALEANVTAISHSPSKENDARKMGAHHFIATGGGDGKVFEQNARTFDLILCTNFQVDMPLAEYMRMLKVGGTFVACGIPEGNFPALPPSTLINHNACLKGTNVGSKAEVLEMLDLVKEKGIQSWIQVRQMKDVEQVIADMDDGKARYRYVLKVDIE